jgi:hypothetical protein
MADEDAAFARRDIHEDGLQLVDHPFECARARRRFAPGKAGAIVRADTGERGNLSLYNCPTQRGRRNAGFEEDDRAAGPRTRDVQAMTTNVNEVARRGKAAALSPRANLLIDHPGG